MGTEGVVQHEGSYPNCRSGAWRPSPSPARSQHRPAPRRTPATWNLKANGGFVSLDLLNNVQVSGGGSDAEAASSDLAEALGTGACVSSAATSNPCPTSPANVSSFALDSSQFAVQKSSGGSASPSPSGSSNCAVPAVRAAPLLSLGPACGSATASEDAKGNPTAEGTGSLVGAQALTVSLNTLLRSGIGGLSLPSAGNLCSSIPAATPIAGSGTTSLPAPVSTVLTTANGLLSGITNGTPLATTSVDSRSPLDGVCSIVGGVVDELGSSPAAALLTDLTSAAGHFGFAPASQHHRRGFGLQGVDGQQRRDAHGDSDTGGGRPQRARAARHSGHADHLVGLARPRPPVRSPRPATPAWSR